MANAKLGTDTDLMAQAARNKQMNDFIVNTMARDVAAVEELEAENARVKPKGEKAKPPFEASEWMVVHDSVLISVAAGGTYVVRAGTRFKDPVMKRDLDTVGAKYVPVA